MLEIDIYLPTHHNDGTRVPEQAIAGLKQRLRERFGGVTYFPQQNEGEWKLGKAVFREAITIARVITSEDAAARTFFKQLKEALKRELRQEDILIVERSVTAV